MSYLFHGQHQNEEVVLVSRQHPFILLHPFLISLAFLLIPFALHVFFYIATWLVVVWIICVIAALIHGGLAWYGWWNSVVLLTSERVVMLHQKGLVHREFSECNLANIQQVSHEIHGWVHTIFGYGTISIFTGGSQKPFELPNLPDPYVIQQEIQRVSVGEGFAEEENSEEGPEETD